MSRSELKQKLKKIWTKINWQSPPISWLSKEQGHLSKTEVLAFLSIVPGGQACEDVIAWSLATVWQQLKEQN